jgi:hypothetical protein
MIAIGERIRFFTNRLVFSRQRRDATFCNFPQHFRASRIPFSRLHLARSPDRLFLRKGAMRRNLAFGDSL